MTADYPTAIGEMFALYNIAWEANSTAIAGYVPEIRWPGVEEKTTPDLSKFWSRVSTQVVREGDAAIGKDEAGAVRLYETAGLIFVQIFGPMVGAIDTAKKMRLLAVLARNSFRGKKTASGVWFRNCRVQELTPDGKFQRYNAVAEFQYTERG